jgi:pimeloyl-ACP methyl ester carboxylesterase
MKYFARLLAELQELVDNHRPGQQLAPPKLLTSVQVAGKRVSYFQMGLGKPGPAVILLHGFGGFFMDWPRVMAPLARKHRVYALDLPGWGFSEPRDQNMGLEDDVAVIREFIRQHELDDVLLVGISYGAAVAWASAAASIPAVKRLLLLNPMPPFPLRYLRSRLYRAIFALNRIAFVSRWAGRLMTKSQYKLVCKENLKHYRLLDTLYLDVGFRVITQPSIHQNLHSHAKKARTIDWSTWEEQVRGIRIPVTILQGTDDKVFSLESARYLNGLIAHADLVEIEDCGHAMVFDQHRKVTAQILALLGGGSSDKADDRSTEPAGD